eukprot:534013_1
MSLIHVQPVNLTEFWSKMHVLRQISPKFHQTLPIIQSLIDHKPRLRHLYDDAAKIESTFQYLLSAFPKHPFDRLHHTISLLWYLVRLTKLDAFYDGVRNDTMIGAFNLGVCERAFKEESHGISDMYETVWRSLKEAFEMTDKHGGARLSLWLFTSTEGMCFCGCKRT